MTPSDFLGLASYLGGMATAFAIVAYLTWTDRPPSTTAPEKDTTS